MNSKLKVLPAILICFFTVKLFAGSISLESPAESFAGEPEKVLIFTKTEGYRHGSISEGVSLIKKLGRKHGFDVDRTEDAGKFNEEHLRKYRLVIFLSTTGDVLNEDQQRSFQNFLRQGGSFMGIHAAADTECNWDWYKALVGGCFKSHPPVQTATLRMKDPEHPSTQMLPQSWQLKDEWYNYKDLKSDVRVLLTLDEATYEGGENGEWHPIAWCQEYEGGRSFYTGLGHTKASYKQPLVQEHILGGIAWCLGR